VVVGVVVTVDPIVLSVAVAMGSRVVLDCRPYVVE